MTDEQLHRRLIAKRLLIIAVLLLLAAAGLLYYRSTQLPALAQYRSLRAQEASLEQRVQQLQNDNASKQSIIEENGRTLVSFAEDRNVFVSRASDLAVSNGVVVTELSVSSVWSEGSMAGQTARVEVEGSLAGVRGFISQYCDPSVTNRITHISCRPKEDYPWMARYIDELQVLKWLDLTAEEQKYASEVQELYRQQQQEILNGGGSVENLIDPYATEPSITLDDMFKDFTFKLYLEVDFLGRQQ